MMKKILLIVLLMIQCLLMYGQKIEGIGKYKLGTSLYNLGIPTRDLDVGMRLHDSLFDISVTEYLVNEETYEGMQSMELHFFDDTLYSITMSDLIDHDLIKNFKNKYRNSKHKVVNKTRVINSRKTGQVTDTYTWETDGNVAEYRTEEFFGQKYNSFQFFDIYNRQALNKANAYKDRDDKKKQKQKDNSIYNKI